MSTLRSDRFLSSLALAAGIGLVGCDNGTGPEDPDSSALRAEAVATFLTNVDATGGAAYGMFLDPRTGTYTFSRTAPCPAGGSHSVAGTGSAELDAATHVLATTWSTTQTQDQCAFIHSRGDQQITAVINGSVTASGSASYQLPRELGQRRQLLAYSSTRVGSTTTTVGDRTRTCDVNVTETYDPASGSLTIRGTVCGHPVNVIRTRG